MYLCVFVCICVYVRVSACDRVCVCVSDSTNLYSRRDR